MRTLFKATGWLLLFVVLLLALLLAIIAWRPQWLIGAINSVQNDWQIEADNPQVTLLPPTLGADQLNLNSAAQVIKLRKVSAAANPSAWWGGSPFWTVELERGDLELSAAPPAESAANSGVALPDIRPFLTFSRVAVGELLISGDNALSARLSAERDGEQINIESFTTLEGSTYEITGTLQETDSAALAVVLQAAVTPEDNTIAPAITAQLSAALDSSSGTRLALGSGDIVVRLAGEEHRIGNLGGTVSISANGELLELKELTGDYLGSGLDTALGWQLAGKVGLAGAQRQADVQGKVGDSEFAYDGSYAADVSSAAGRFSLASTGLPTLVDLAPYTEADVFPANLSGQVNYSAQPLSVQIDDLVVDTPANALAGLVKLVLPAGENAQQSIVADLAAQRLFVPLGGGSGDGSSEDAADAVPEGDGADQDAADQDAADQEAADQDTAEPEDVAQAESADGKDRLLSSEEIDWSWLSAAVIDVALTSEELRLEDAKFTDFAMQLANKDGRLQLSPLSATLGSGGFSGAASIAQIAGPETADAGSAGGAVDASVDLAVNGISLEDFGFVPQDELSGGALEVAIDLTTRGNSVAELAAGLNGDILAMVEEATLMNDFVELAGSDLIMEALNKLNPFAKSDPTTELECALVKFAATDGELETRNQLVMETTKMEIVGSGKVNLNDEKLGITLTPNAKSGVGVNVGSVIKFLKLGGTLSAPRPVADAGGLLKSGLAIGAAISTGGASIVAESMAKRLTAGESACNAVRAERGAKAPAADAEKRAEEGSP